MEGGAGEKENLTLCADPSIPLPRDPPLRVLSRFPGKGQPVQSQWLSLTSSFCPTLPIPCLRLGLQLLIQLVYPLSEAGESKGTCTLGAGHTGIRTWLKPRQHR